MNQNLSNSKCDLLSLLSTSFHRHLLRWLKAVQNTTYHSLNINHVLLKDILIHLLPYQTVIKEVTYVKCDCVFNLPLFEGHFVGSNKLPTVEPDQDYFNYIYFLKNYLVHVTWLYHYPLFIKEKHFPAKTWRWGGPATDPKKSPLSMGNMSERLISMILSHIKHLRSNTSSNSTLRAESP